MADQTELQNFDPSAYLASKQVAPPSMPDVDEVQLAQFDPNAYLQAKSSANYDSLQNAYGGVTQQLLAGVEGAARGASLGTSDFLEKQLARVNPEMFSAQAIAGRQAANPLTSFGGNLVGSAGLLAATGGAAGPAEAALAARGIGPVASAAIGTALEGGIFGAGNVVSDMALGDPNLNAQKVLSDIGLGAALGGSLGVLSKVLPAIPAMMRKVTGRGTAEAMTAPEGMVGLENPIMDTPSGKPASSYEELKKQVSDLKKFGGDPDLFALPQKPIVNDSLADMNQVLRVPINEMDLGSLESQEARDIYKTKMQMPGEAGQILRDATVARKKDFLGAIDRQIESIAPDYEASGNALEAGKRITDSLTDAIEQKRDSIGPLIGQIKEMPLPEENHLSGVLDYLTNPEVSPRANPKIANMFDTAGDQVKIKPYSTAMGIDKSTYNAVDQMVASLKENPDSFDKLFDIRKGLEQNVDVAKLGDASKEVGNAKAAMMDYIQDTAQRANPDVKVRDAFKAYAANEEDANYIEKQIGAQIGSDNWRSLAKNKPEEGILDKIFRDTKTVDSIKRILGPEEFKKVLSDYMSVLRQDMTQEGVFSSNKFYSAMRRNQYGLSQAFADQPHTLKTIQSYLTGLKTFVDHMPANPSGTAPTLMRSIMDAGYNIPKILGNLKDYGGSKLEQFRQGKEINALLGGQAEKASQLTSIQGLIEKVNNKMISGAKSLFGKAETLGTATSAGAYLSDKEYNKHIDNLKKSSLNPDHLMENVVDNSTHLYDAAPNITQSMYNAITQGVQFLMSKLPVPSDELPLATTFTPSIGQKVKFNRYFQAVNDPLTTFKEVKQGTLTPEHMEALQAVHPALLQDMRQKVMENMDLKKAKKLPYAQKVSLAQFIGKPLDVNMTPQAIQSNQMSFTNPQLSQQNTQASKKSTLGGLKQLDVSERTATATQKERENK